MLDRYSQITSFLTSPAVLLTVLLGGLAGVALSIVWKKFMTGKKMDLPSGIVQVLSSEPPVVPTKKKKGPDCCISHGLPDKGLSAGGYGKNPLPPLGT